MAKAPTQSERKKMMAAQAAAQVKSGKRPPPPKSMFDTDDVPVSRPMPMPGGGLRRVALPLNPNRPMPIPKPGRPTIEDPGSAIGSMTGTRPGGKGGAGPAAQAAAAQASGGKGGPRPMGPGQVAQMAKLADMAGMQRMKGGGYLKKNIDGKASKGKTKGRNC